IARPIAYLAPWRLVLMSKAPGRTLAASLEDPRHARRRGAEAAAWLARLHGVPLPDPPPAGDPAREAGPERFVRELAAAAPDHAARIDALGRLLAEGGAPRSSRAVLLHGDLHPRNVFIDADRVTVIDFDHCTAGDPAGDVAYLVSQIQVAGFLRFGDFHWHDAAARAALATYLRQRPPVEPDAFLTRVARYRARWLLESLHYELCVVRARRPETVPAFLGEAERSLAREMFA
ncbi:MAG TPA: phosphotransferase, partial [Longimicrobiales bacterium]